MYKIIYETSGRAAEYYPLGCHIYEGCTHGCTYCYNTTGGRFSAGLKRKDFHKSGAPGSGYISQVDAEADKLVAKGDKRRIMLSFTCDPYQPLDDEFMLTRTVLWILKSRRLPVAILTKGGNRSLRDFDILEPTDEYGITLTGWLTVASRFEPGAALPDERLLVLRKAKEKGLKTWVSFEPVLYPIETIKLINMVAPFTDIIRVGKLNHVAPLAPIDWGNFCEQAIDLLEALHKTYYIKKDLAKHIGRPEGVKGGPGW